MSLLERLRAPSASELGRKRKIDANPPPPKGKKRSTQNVRKNLAKASTLALSSDGSMEVLEWWKNNSVELPYWSQAAQWIFLVQPSSAAAECVFSILNRIGDTQANSLEDYVESAFMLHIISVRIYNVFSLFSCVFSVFF